MKKLLAVAAAEVADKLLVFPAAILLGVFPPAMAALRPGRIPADAREASALFLAILVSSTLAVGLGLRSTAGDLASGRAAFYLARPLTAFQLWAGKLAGSLLVVFGAAVLAVLPAVAAGEKFGRWRIVTTIRTLDAILPASASPAALALVAAAVLTVLFLLSQAIGVAALARSPWLVADAALAAAAIVLVTRTVDRLRAAGAFVPQEAALVALGALVATAAAVGCYRAVAEGTGVKRAAAGQSRVFWAIAGTAVVLFALFGIWVLRARPADLKEVWWIAPAPRGDWIAESGPARWHDPVFLENVRTGEFFRVPSMPVISPDGSAAAWTEKRPGLPLASFVPRSVSLSDPRHPATVWETKDLHEPPLLVFSPDAQRLAVVASDRIVVWNAAAGGMLAAARPPRPLWEEARGFTGATFAGDDVLKIYAVRRSAGNLRAIDLFSFDVRQRIFRQTGTAGPFSGTFPILANAARDRILVREKGATVHLLDGETGRTIETFGGEGVGFRTASFLSNGGIALFESTAGAGRVVVLSPAGEEQRRISVGPAERGWLLGERRPGTLAVAAGTAEEARRREYRVLMVDLVSGVVQTWATGVVPVAPYASTLSGDPGSLEPQLFEAPRQALDRGWLGTRLFETPHEALVELEGPGRLRRIHPSR